MSRFEDRGFTIFTGVSPATTGAISSSSSMAWIAGAVVGLSVLGVIVFRAGVDRETWRRATSDDWAKSSGKRVLERSLSTTLTSLKSLKGDLAEHDVYRATVPAVWVRHYDKSLEPSSEAERQWVNALRSNDYEIELADMSYIDSDAPFGGYAQEIVARRKGSETSDPRLQMALRMRTFQS